LKLSKEFDQIIEKCTMKRRKIFEQKEVYSLTKEPGLGLGSFIHMTKID